MRFCTETVPDAGTPMASARKQWWVRLGLNQRPLPCEGTAPFDFAAFSPHGKQERSRNTTTYLYRNCTHGRAQWASDDPDGWDFDWDDDGPDDEDDYDAGEDCGRWDNGRLGRYCRLAGSEFCDFECPYRDGGR